MKKTIKISLGGMAFMVEEDAYALLHNYLESLKMHLGDSNETAEIVRDIEERAAELFSEMLAGKEIVNITMVEKIIETLGSPEQITSEQADESSNSDFADNQPERKRLYRDGDNAIVGGVCSGLGAYFNADPLIFRIVLLALIFAKGLGFLIYLILWIAVPRAESVRQRMEMRGEKVNLSNLEKNIRNEYEKVKKNMEKQRISNFFERLFNSMGRFFERIGGMLGVFAKIVLIILAICFISIGLVGLFSTMVSMFLGDIVVSLLPAHSGITFGQLISATFDIGSVLWITVPVFFIAAIPFIAFIYIGLRMAFWFKARDSIFFVIASVLWISAVVVLASVLFFQARSFSIRESVKEKVELFLPEQNISVLRLTAEESFEKEDFYFEKFATINDYSLAYFEEATRIIGKPQLYIGKSRGSNYEIIIEKRSRGASRQLARVSADRIIVNYTLTDSTLEINPYFILPEDLKWRTQDVDITINVPEGKKVFIDPSIESILGSEQEYCYCWPDEMIGKTWLMKGDRLLPADK